MDRIEYTDKITRLIRQMVDEGEHPVGCDWYRSQQAQHADWQVGRDSEGKKIGETITNCDGVKNISGHQTGRALDILFIENGAVSPPKKGWTYWHEKWIELGGGREISWDEDHFE